MEQEILQIIERGGWPVAMTVIFILLIVKVIVPLTKNYISKANGGNGLMWDKYEELHKRWKNIENHQLSEIRADIKKLDEKYDKKFDVLSEKVARIEGRLEK